jgi:hypothetical protein
MFVNTCETVITALGAVVQCAPQVAYGYWSAYAAPVVYGTYGWAHPHFHHAHHLWR